MLLSLQIEEIAKQGMGLFKSNNLIVSYGLKILGAIIFYIVGNWIIGKITRITRRVMEKRNLDVSLQSFLASMIKVLLLVLLIISILGILGVETSSFAALLVGAGVAIGSALNGTLGNFAGGVMMLIFKPFKIGDIVEAQNVIGTVTEQGIFNTTLLTPDNKTVIVPNGPLSTGVITNYNTHGNLRVDLTMVIAPDVPVSKARDIALAAMRKHPKVLATPAPEVNVLKVSDGVTSLAIRPYTTQADYWDVYFEVQELVKQAWDEQGITLPIPHRVVINK